MYKLYIGNETYISFNHAKEMVNDLLSQPDITYVHIDAERVNGQDLIEKISSNSLFSTSRVIFLKRLYRNKEKDLLIPFLLEHLEKNISDSIVIWEDQKVSSVTKYVKFFKSQNSLEEYNKLSKVQFKKYAKDLCTKYSLPLDNILIEILSQYSNYDIERFDNSLKKLKLLEKEQYDEEDIHQVAANTLEQDIWKLLDQMNIQGGKPIEILENLLKQGIDPLYIIPMIARNLRLITLTKYLIEKNTSYSEIASLIKIPPFTVKPLVDVSSRYNWDKIKSKYEKLSSLDYNIKIGLIEPKLGLTLFCTTI